MLKKMSIEVITTDKTVTFDMDVIITFLHMSESCYRGNMLVQFHLRQSDGNIFLLAPHSAAALL